MLCVCVCVCVRERERVCACVSCVFRVCLCCCFWVCISVAKLLWTEVFNESSNNSGLQSMYFLSSKKRIYYIWNTHDVSWYTWCGFYKPVFSKRYAHIQVDSMNTASPLLYYLTVLTNRGILFSSCQKMNLPIQGFLDPPHATGMSSRINSPLTLYLER